MGVGVSETENNRKLGYWLIFAQDGVFSGHTRGRTDDEGDDGGGTDLDQVAGDGGHGGDPAAADQDHGEGLFLFGDPAQDEAHAGDDDQLFHMGRGGGAGGFSFSGRNTRAPFSTELLKLRGIFSGNLIRCGIPKTELFDRSDHRSDVGVWLSSGWLSGIILNTESRK